MKCTVALVLFGLSYALAATTTQKQNPNAWPMYGAFNEKYSESKNILHDAILQAFERLREIMLNGSEELGIPVFDPFFKDFFTYSVESESAELAVEMNNLTVTGMAGFNITNIDVNIVFLEAAIDFEWPVLALHMDRYWLDGTLFSILPLFGEGAADLEVSVLTIGGGAKFSGANDQLLMTEFDFEVNFDELNGYLEGFLGGGELGEEINEIINNLGKDIFDMLKGVITDNVEILLMDAVNEALDGYSLQDILDIILGGGTTSAAPKQVSPAPGIAPPVADKPTAVATLPKSNANEYLDELLANLREFMIENGMNNMQLPDLIESFSEEWAGITWHGEASLTQGYLQGLETIARHGDATLEFIEEGGIRIASELDFDDLLGGYKMHVDFMDIGINTYADVFISGIKLDFDAQMVFGENGTQATINTFDINDPGVIVVNIDGLGLLDFLLETLAFIVMNIFSGLILGAISDDLKDALQEILEGITNPPPEFLTYM